MPLLPPALPPDGRAAPLDTERPRVWVVDDSATEARRAEALLAPAHDVTVFDDAGAALERLAHEGRAPHLLLLDWNLPGVSGREACAFVRERFDEVSLPVLVLTASGAREDRRVALAVGANDFVQKPYDDDELLARVRTLVRVRMQAEAQREREARYRALFESIDDGFCIMQMLHDAAGRTVDYRFLETNAAFERHTGLVGAQGRTARELVPDLDTSWFERYGRVADTGEPSRFESHAPAMGRWFDVYASRVGAPERRLVALVFKDVTARRAAEVAREQALARERAARAEAEAEREKLHAVFELAPVAIALLEGPEHRYAYVNLAQRRLHGDIPMLGRTVRELLPGEAGEGFVRLLDEVERTGVPYVGREAPFLLPGRPEVETEYLNFTYQPWRVAGGGVQGVLVCAFPVTEQVRARQQVEALAAQLRESEERLRRVVDASGTAIWELDAVTNTVVVQDPRHRELLGLPEGTPLTVEAIGAALHPGSRVHWARAMEAALAGEDGGSFHVELRTLSTPERWLEGRGRVLFDAEGRPRRFVGATVDITARRAAEAAREALLDALLAQSVFGVALLRGPTLVFARVNAAYRQMVGGRDVAGQALLEALPELAGQGFDALLHEVRRTGVPHVGREVRARLDRTGAGRIEDGYFNYVYQPVRRDAGAQDDVLVLTHDVTDAVRARQEVERLVALEQERAGFEQQLIGIVSHDLRTPIAAITMGAAVLLRRPDVEERQQRNLERILGSANRASRMIHDLLDFTQARLGGGLATQRVPGDFHAVVRQVVDETRVTHPGRALRLAQVGDGAGVFDADRVSQLVGNLLSNALHYSPSDSVVRVETRGEPDALVLTVHNTGAPIAPEVLPRLFQPLQRGVGGPTEARSVGLGLYIVDQVVRAHGGSVDVTSTAAAGTTFTVRLPRAGA